jgi:hypothetical protein
VIEVEYSIPNSAFDTDFKLNSDFSLLALFAFTGVKHATANSMA